MTNYLYLINQTIKRKNFILCKNTKEKLKMLTNLKNNNRLNVYIPIIANDLKRDYLVGNLIIPYMPYSNIQTIIQKEWRKN